MGINQRRSQAEQGAGVRINRYTAFTIAPHTLLEVGDQRRDLACRYSRQAAIRHPPVEQVDVRLRPRAVADRRGWRHDSAANSADPVVDGFGVGFHRVVAGEVEPRAHALDVAFGEQRKDVRLEACLAAHGISDLRQGLIGCQQHIKSMLQGVPQKLTTRSGIELMICTVLIPQCKRRPGSNGARH
jgi:hypothetical protein